MAQAPSSHGCFNAYLRRFKKRDDKTCCYCDYPVDNAEYALFVYAKWGVSRKTADQAVGTELTPEIMFSLMLRSERICILIESFVTLAMKTRQLDGRRHGRSVKSNGRAAVRVGFGRTNAERVVRDYKPEPNAREV